jgi:uncharacterized membrane protein YgcG
MEWKSECKILISFQIKDSITKKCSSKKGIRVSPRPHLQYWSENESVEMGRHVAISASKGVYTSSKPFPPIRRRLKASLKQIVGGLFTGFGFVNARAEREIIRTIVRISHQRNTANVGGGYTGPMDHQKILESGAEEVKALLRNLIDDILEEHLKIFASRIFHQDVNLRWKRMSNHCQKMCDSLLDHEKYRDFIGHSMKTGTPMYLFSFVCGARTWTRGDIPDIIRPSSRRYAPNGLIEEYLLRFRRFNHHIESDVLDTLSEYWSDWANLGEHLYPHQDVFPWDCTEAFGFGLKNNGEEITCGDCSLTKHVWAFPFDSWSLITLHLFRPYAFYSKPQVNVIEYPWLHNRIKVLTGLHSLNVIALAIRNTLSFRRKCVWMSNKIISMRNEIKWRRGHWNRLLSRAEKTLLDYSHGRTRMAGIFRAQPDSNFFEYPARHDCELAEWADLAKPQQVREYEKRRNERIVMEFIPQDWGMSSEYDSQSHAQFVGDTSSGDTSGGVADDYASFDQAISVPDSYLDPGSTKYTEFLSTWLRDESNIISGFESDIDLGGSGGWVYADYSTYGGYYGGDYGGGYGGDGGGDGGGGGGGGGDGGGGGGGDS